MKPIVPSRRQVDLFREIAGAQFDYAAVKRLGSDAGWELVADEPDLGFVQYEVALGADCDTRLLSIGTPKLSAPPHVLLPLYYFPKDDNDDLEEQDRAGFDQAFCRLLAGMCQILGDPSATARMSILTGQAGPTAIAPGAC